MHSFFFETARVEEKINYCFQDKALLELAFIHRSYWNENRTQVAGHNERLEFLGDSILGLLVAQYLYKTCSECPEGTLSDLRAQLVQAEACVLYLDKLQVHQHLQLGKGESMNQGKGRASILADLFEAIMGAIYLDGGYEKAKEFFFSHFQSEVDAKLRAPARNWKAELQDWMQKKHQKTPIYKVLGESGPSHEKQFVMAVFVGDEQLAKGCGQSKKQAQVDAARCAMESLT